MFLAISGASGKTGYRIAEEALAKGYKVRLLIRRNSVLPSSLQNCEKFVVSLANSKELDNALKGCDALLIATGARPSVDLTGPARVDALGVQRQVESCERVGVKRLILVSSLCAGRLIHPLNLFGLILLWKKFGEAKIQGSNLEWTIIRPGGLSDREDNILDENIKYTPANLQEEGYIPRRLVAKCCIDALKTPASIGKIIEITSSTEEPRIKFDRALTEIFS